MIEKETLELCLINNTNIQTCLQLGYQGGLYISILTALKQYIYKRNDTKLSLDVHSEILQDYNLLPVT